MGVVKTLLAGYSSGKEGDVIVPLEASILPPHASKVEKGVLESLTYGKLSITRPIVCVNSLTLQWQLANNHTTNKNPF